MKRRRGARLALAALVALAMAVVDQGTKAMALAQLSQQARIPLIGDLLGLQLAFNPGTIMSLGSSSTWVFTVIASAAAIGLCYAAWRAPSKGWAIAIGFVWGGAVGNLIDRLFAPPGFGVGHVTDMLAYGNLFIGNIADVAIGIGVGLGILQLIRDHRAERHSAAAAAASPSEA
jgi:signal peptidase II